MSHDDRIQSERDSEWRETDAWPEDMVRLREKRDLRETGPADADDERGDDDSE